jgi:hypothetical protein
LKTGQSSVKRQIFINGRLCVSMAEGARYATGELGRTVCLWEIQRVLEGLKHIEGLEVIRADEPLPRRVKPAKGKPKTVEHRRKISAAMKGKTGYWRGKRMNDLILLRLGQAKVGKKNPAAKLTENDVLDIQIALEEGEKQLTLALRYGVSEALISRIKHGKRWRYLAEGGEGGAAFPAPPFA